MSFFWDWKIARPYFAIAAVGILAEVAIVVAYWLQRLGEWMGIPPENVWLFWLPIVIAAFGCFAPRVWNLARRAWRRA